MRGVPPKSLVLGAFLAAAPLTAAHAAAITYTIDRTVGSGGITGTIETNGMTGVLSPSAILDWTLNLTAGGASYTLTKANSVVVLGGADLTATASSLLFNYSGTDYGSLLFQDGLYSGTHYYCDQATGDSACRQGESVVPQSVYDPSFQSVMRSGNVVIATSGVSAVPLPAAMPLFGTAVLTLAGLGYGIGRRKASRPVGLAA